MLQSRISILLSFCFYNSLQHATLDKICAIVCTSLQITMNCVLTATIKALVLSSWEVQTSFYFPAHNHKEPLHNQRDVSI